MCICLLRPQHRILQARICVKKQRSMNFKSISGKPWEGCINFIFNTTKANFSYTSYFLSLPEFYLWFLSDIFLIYKSMRPSLYLGEITVLWRMVPLISWGNKDSTRAGAEFVRKNTLSSAASMCSGDCLGFDSPQPHLVPKNTFPFHPHNSHLQEKHIVPTLHTSLACVFNNCWLFNKQ